MKIKLHQGASLYKTSSFYDFWLAHSSEGNLFCLPPPPKVHTSFAFRTNFCVDGRVRKDNFLRSD